MKSILQSIFCPVSHNQYGRLEIPDLYISIPLYESNGEDAQEIVDKSHSAALIHWKSQTAIADHYGQNGFERLPRAIVGKTTAIIRRRKDKEQYICVSNQDGHIKIGETNKMFDQNWRAVSEVYKDCLCIYTCKGHAHGDIQDVTLTFWERVSMPKHQNQHEQKGEKLWSL